MWHLHSQWSLIGQTLFGIAYQSKLHTVICLIRAPGALARSYLINLGESWSSQLSNGSFGLKIGQLLKKLCLFLAIYDSIGFPQSKGAPLLGEVPLIGRLRYVWHFCGLERFYSPHSKFKKVLSRLLPMGFPVFLDYCVLNLLHLLYLYQMLKSWMDWTGHRGWMNNGRRTMMKTQPCSGNFLAVKLASSEIIQVRDISHETTVRKRNYLMKMLRTWRYFFDANFTNISIQNIAKIVLLPIGARWI